MALTFQQALEKVKSQTSTGGDIKTIKPKMSFEEAMASVKIQQQPAIPRKQNILEKTGLVRTDLEKVKGIMPTVEATAANLVTSLGKNAFDIATYPVIGVPKAVYGLGKELVGASKDFPAMEQSQNDLKKMNVQLENKIAELKSQGKDTTQLERQLAENKKSKGVNMFKELGTALPEATYKTLAPGFVQKGVSAGIESKSVGEGIYQGIKDLAEDPFQLLPYGLMLKGKLGDKKSKINQKIETPDIFKKDVATLRTEKIKSGLETQNRYKTVNKAYTENTKTITNPDGTKTTITPVDTFGKYNITPEIKSGKIQMGSYKTGEGALGKIKTEVSNIDAIIDTTLKNTGQKIGLENLRNEVIARAKADPQLRQSGEVQSTINKINSKFKDFQNSYGDALDIAEINNIRKIANRDWKVDTHDASRVLGDAARDVVYSATPDMAVRTLLFEQGNLLAAKNYANKLNGTAVVGGRLGNYAMRTIGAVIGSTVKNAPVVGGIVGMLGGEWLANALQQGQFKSPFIEAKALLQRSNKK